MNNKFRIYVPAFQSFLKSYNNSQEIGLFYVGVFNTLHTYPYMPKEEYVIQQYSGIKDVNGVEIFEGDVLKTTEDLDNDCMYDDETTYTKYSVVRKAPGYFFYDEDEPFGFLINTHDGVNSYVEVVGNIYNKSELLDPFYGRQTRDN